MNRSNKSICFFSCLSFPFLHATRLQAGFPWSFFLWKDSTYAVWTWDATFAFLTHISFQGSASSSTLVERIPVDGEGCSQEATEEVAWPFSSGLRQFAPGTLLLLSITCVAHGVLPGWQFGCIPGSFSPLKTCSCSFTAQCFSTRFVPSPVFVHPVNFQTRKPASPQSQAVT